MTRGSTVYTGGLDPALYRVVLASPRNPLNIGAGAGNE